MSRYRDILVLKGAMSNACIIAILRNYYSNVFLQSEHNPPHIHAIYNDDVAAIDFMTGKVLEGHLPGKALTMVQEWVELNREALKTIWETQEFKQLPPLE